MTLPDADDDGLLPPGLHDATLDELRARFGAFQSSERRPRLQRALEGYVAEVRDAAIGAELVVDGSFVTAKPDPGDVDVIVILPRDHPWAEELRPDQYNVISAARVRQRHGLDLLVAAAESQALREYLELFAQVRGHRDRRKGIVRLVP